ncbi:uncharacterized protein [Nicotiana sylvestris]|uniref:uncharacterized protein n=1 Tax=Nicotiana sylvestris TaxID=4096 RepID=UPI00388C38FD
MPRDKRFRYPKWFNGAPSGGRGFYSRYSGHQDQISGQQPAILRGCFEYGDLGHVRRFYPRLRGKIVQQGSQPMIIVPAAAPVVRPPRGRGQVSRGRPSGGGPSGGGHSGEIQSVGIPARFYAFSAIPDTVASNVVIIGIISICGRDASVLFDPGSTYSYVSSLFTHFLGVPRESLGTLVYVSTPVGDSVIVDQIYWSCIMTFCGYETRAGLLLLDMTDFEVILGIDWLSPYHAILDFHAKTVTLTMPELPRLEWKGSFNCAPNRIIYFIKARHMVDKGYLAYVRL